MARKGKPVKLGPPFLGLAENLDESLLKPGHAVACENVMVNRGTIESRKVLENILKPLDYAANPDPAGDNNRWPRDDLIRQIGIFRGRGERVEIVAMTNMGPRVGPVAGTDATELRDPTTVGSQHPYFPSDDDETSGVIVPHTDGFYFIFGRMYAGALFSGINRFLWFNPESQEQNDYIGPYLLGLDLLPELNAFLTGEENEFTGGPFPSGTYAFAFTRYNSKRGIESNGRILASGQEYVVADQWLKFGFAENPSLATQQADRPHDKIRIYVKHIAIADDATAGGEEQYRFVGEAGVDEVVEEWVGEQLRYFLTLGANHYSSTLSVSGEGPFMPVRNGLPPSSNTACMYQGMMVYASIDPDTRGAIFWSEEGQPEHVAADDFYGFPDQGRELTRALVIYQGRLIAFKESAIYVITGVLPRRTNRQATLGEVSLGSYQVFKAVDDIGCSNIYGGNCVVECDGLLYFVGLDGIYAFNGIRALNVSQPVRSSILVLDEDVRRRGELVNDARHGLLWVFYPHGAEGSGGTFFCFDYRQAGDDPLKGSWTAHFVYNGINAVTAAPTIHGTRYWDMPEDAHFIASASGGCVAALSGSGTVSDEFASERFNDFDWSYHLVPAHLGSIERPKRVHYVSVRRDESMPGDVYLTDHAAEQTMEHTIGERNGKVPVNRWVRYLDLQIKGEAAANIRDLVVDYEHAGWR